MSHLFLWNKRPKLSSFFFPISWQRYTIRIFWKHSFTLRDWAFTLSLRDRACHPFVPFFLLYLLLGRTSKTDSLSWNRRILNAMSVKWECLPVCRTTLWSARSGLFVRSSLSLHSRFTEGRTFLSVTKTYYEFKVT